MLAAFLESRAHFGGLVGGYLADRFTQRPVISISLLLAGPLSIALPHLNGRRYLDAAASGVLLLSSWYVLAVKGQEVLNKNVGVAFGLCSDSASAWAGWASFRWVCSQTHFADSDRTRHARPRGLAPPPPETGSSAVQVPPEERLMRPPQHCRFRCSMSWNPPPASALTCQTIGRAPALRCRQNDNFNCSYFGTLGPPARPATPTVYLHDLGCPRHRWRSAFQGHQPVYRRRFFVEWENVYCRAYNDWLADFCTPTPATSRRRAHPACRHSRLACDDSTAP